MSIWFKTKVRNLFFFFEDRKKFVLDRRNFLKQFSMSTYKFDFLFVPKAPSLKDYRMNAGIGIGHYFHQDLLVAQRIFNSNPERHIDVGSRIDGFVAHVASFRKIEIMDTRHWNSTNPNILFSKIDLMSSMEGYSDIADSISCLHALEHFGLGRYGDAVAVDGWMDGINNLAKMLKPSGTLYLSVPTSDKQRIEFNSHRVFSISFLSRILMEKFEVVRLDFVNDQGDLITNVDPNSSEASQSFNANYGCSIWELRKLEI